MEIVLPIDLRRAPAARSRKFGILIGSLVIVFAVLSALVAARWGPLIDLDQATAQRAYDVTTGRDSFIGLLDVVAVWLGPIALRAVLLLCALVAAVRRELQMALWLFVVVVLENVVAPLSKLVLDRPRPVWESPIAAVGQFSYPSGHAAAAGMLVAALTLLTIVHTGKGFVRRLLIALWVVLAVLIGLDRIFLGVHFISDVVGGVLLGVLVTVAAWVAVMWNAVSETTKLVSATGTGSKRVAVILNPIKVLDIAVFRSRVRLAAEAAGWDEPLWYETTVDDPGATMAHSALGEGVDLVIVAGGDGTVRVVCNELARTGVSAGIVPLGTGNLLARNLAIPLHMGDAIGTAFGGQDRAIDIVSLQVDDRPATAFTVMAGLGFDAAIMTGTADQLKARMGWLAYVVSAMRQLRYPATKVTVSVDGAPFVRHRARTVLIGNVGFLQGGIPLLPDALLDDGVVDVVVIAPARTAGWLRVIVRVLSRRRHTDERLDRMTGRTVVVRADKPTAMQLDGDPIGEGRQLRAEIQPGVLLVRVPH